MSSFRVSSASITCPLTCALAEPCSSPAEDVINCPFYVTVGIVLIAAFGVQSVLVAVEPYSIISLLIAIRRDSNRLGSGAICIVKVHVVHLEVGADNIHHRRPIQVASGCGGLATLECDNIVFVASSALVVIYYQQSLHFENMILLNQPLRRLTRQFLRIASSFLHS